MAVTSASPMYITHFVSTAILFLSHLFLVRRYVVSGRRDGSCVLAIDTPSSRICFSGFRDSVLGTAVLFYKYAWSAYIIVSILMVTIGKYSGVWVFDPELPPSNWDECAPFFVLSWGLVTFVMVVSCVWSQRLQTVYKSRASLEDSSYVNVGHKVTDFSIGVSRKHEELCLVLSKGEEDQDYRRFISTDHFSMLSFKSRIFSLPDPDLDINSGIVHNKGFLSTLRRSGLRGKSSEINRKRAESTDSNRVQNFFIYELSRYCWNPEQSSFMTPHELSCHYLRKINRSAMESVSVYKTGANYGLTVSQHRRLLNIYGTNDVCIPAENRTKMFMNEICSMFYIYQFFAITLTIFYDYVTYAIMIIILLAICLVRKVETEYSQRQELRQMAEMTSMVWVHRATHGSMATFFSDAISTNDTMPDDDPSRTTKSVSGVENVSLSHSSWIYVKSTELVPGDLVAVGACRLSGDLNSDDEQGNEIFTFDAKLVLGSTVVDESLLTGETMPIQKFELPLSQNRMPHITENSNTVDPVETEIPKKYSLFAATKLLTASNFSYSGNSDPMFQHIHADLANRLENDEFALAIVTFTASSTQRGRLLCVILHGVTLDSSWKKELSVSFTILGILCGLFFLPIAISRGLSITSFLTGVFCITSLISPLLVIATVGPQVSAATRLRSGESSILCGSADNNLKKNTNATKTLTPMIIGKPASTPLMSKFTAENTICTPSSKRKAIRVYCRDVQRLAYAGRVTQMCFDKTGTLTKSGLDFIGCATIIDDKVWHQEGDANQDGGQSTVKPCTLRGPFLPGEDDVSLDCALAITQSCTRIQTGGVNRLIGHMVDVKMVGRSEANGWVYDQRMTSVSKNLTQHTSHLPQVAGSEYTNKRPTPLFSSRVHSFKVLCLNTFCHNSMTMSVVVEDFVNDRIMLFCKGSHEAILHRCTFVQKHLEDAVIKTAEMHARNGCYVLAVACRVLPVELEGENLDQIPREVLETDLNFIGLLLFRNELKYDSAAHIKTLKEGGIDSVMVTGDSAMTGVRIAREVGIIPIGHRVLYGSVQVATINNLSNEEIVWSVIGEHESQETRILDIDQTEKIFKDDVPTSLCVSGDCFEILREDGRLVEYMSCRNQCTVEGRGYHNKRPGLVDCDCPRIRVYGRMLPQHKIDVVNTYQGSGMRLVCGMCGDGGNDAGALRAAATGLALGGSVEASISSPFTTESDSIGAIKILLAEARGALVTATAAYRFLICRGVLLSGGKTILLYLSGSYLSPIVFIYVDILLAPVLLFGIGASKPISKLAYQGPQGSLLSPEMVCGSIVSISWLLSFIGILVGSLKIIENEPWFSYADHKVPLHQWTARSSDFESSIFAFWLIFVSLDLALLYSYGRDHRQPLYKNRTLISIYVITLLPILYILLFPSDIFHCGFKLNCMEEDYIAAKDSWINKIMFPYDRIGGDEWSVGSDIQGNYLHWFRFVVLCILILMSVIHHLLYVSIVYGPITKSWIPSIGWSSDKTTGCIPYMKKLVFKQKNSNTSYKIREDKNFTGFD